MADRAINCAHLAQVCDHKYSIFQFRMTGFITQSVVTDKLSSTIFTKIILFFRRLLAISLYLCTSAIRAVKVMFICIYKKQHFVP